jgi:hypothetical protein
MDTTLIFDYIENVKGSSTKKVTHVEDYIETHPDNDEHITCVYSLFSVDFADEKAVMFIQTASSSANVVLPADEVMMEELFPDHVVHNTDESTRDSTDSSELGEDRDSNS